jgi:hypothetical protein
MDVFPREKFVAAAGLLAAKNNDNFSEKDNHLTPLYLQKPKTLCKNHGVENREHKTLLMLQKNTNTLKKRWN